MPFAKSAKGTPAPLCALAAALAVMRYFVALLFLAMFGCTSVRTLTEGEYGLTTGRKVLSEDMLICGADGGGSLPKIQLLNRYSFGRNRVVRSCPAMETLGILKQGSEISVASIERHHIVNLKEVTHVYALGKTTLEAGSEITFYYHLGFLQPEHFWPPIWVDK
jgi:hypothetical protein